MTVKEKAQGAALSARPADKEKFSDRLNDFLRANRKALIILGIVVIALVVFVGAYSIVAQDRLNRSTVALERLEAQFDAWTSSSEADRPGKGDSILAEADALRKSYPKSYAAQRAAVVKARILFERKDYAGAEAAFTLIADEAPASHLAPVALSNAASMAEERGDSEAALSYLTRADAKYPSAPGSARVVFSIGRVHEGMKQYDKALEAYNRLVARGDDDDWTKLARDRIIFLRSTGLAK